MATDLVAGEIGPEAKYDVKIVDGKIVMAVKYDGAEADAELLVKIEAGMFVDKLAAAIPGQIDNAILAVLKGALLK